MDNGEPLPSYEGLAAAFAKAKAEKEREEAQGLKGWSEDTAAANKQGELRFKASHGLIVAFFCWILYNRSEEHTSELSHSGESRMPSSA